MEAAFAEWLRLGSPGVGRRTLLETGDVLQTVVLRRAALYLEDKFLIAAIWRGSGATFKAQIVLGSQQEYLEGLVPLSNIALQDI